MLDLYEAHGTHDTVCLCVRDRVGCSRHRSAGTLHGSEALMTTRLGRYERLFLLVYIAGALWAILACGGGGKNWEPVPDPPQHLEYDTVRIEYGEDDQLDPGADGMQTVQQPLVGDPSDIASFTLNTIAGTNSAFLSILGLIDAIKEADVTAYNSDTRTFIWEYGEWGENKDNWLKLVVVERDTEARTNKDQLRESHTFELYFGKSAEDNALVADGEFDLFEGTSTVGERQNGEGILRIYFNNKRLYDQDSPQGIMRIAFRSKNGVRQVRTGFFKTNLNSPDRQLNTIYEYSQFADKRGRFRFFGNTNINEGPRREFVSVNAAWSGDRDGLVAVRATDGNLDGEFLFRQCWDPELVVTYMETQPSVPELEGGSKEDCAPGLRALMLEAPMYSDAPEQDPGIPNPHPEENP